MKTTLLVTTCNRGHLLVHSLGRLFHLTMPDELLVIDDGGNDDTERVVTEFARLAPMVETRYIYTHNPGVTLCSHARNVGIKEARYDQIVTSEPELVFKTDVLKQFAELRSEHPRDVISAGLIWFAKEGYVPDVAELVPPEHAQQAHNWIAPFTALWDRNWLLEIGGWDEGFPGPWGWDDTDLLTRLRVAGYGQHVAPDVQAIHQWHGLGADHKSQNESYFLSKSFHRDWSDESDLVANKEREWGVPKPRP